MISHGEAFRENKSNKVVIIKEIGLNTRVSSSTSKRLLTLLTAHAGVSAAFCIDVHADVN